MASDRAQEKRPSGPSMEELRKVTTYPRIHQATMDQDNETEADDSIAPENFYQAPNVADETFQSYAIRKEAEMTRLQQDVARANTYMESLDEKINLRPCSMAELVEVVKRPQPTIMACSLVLIWRIPVWTINPRL